MTDIQQKLVELLIELDALCQQEGIPYFLCKETALAACTRGTLFPADSRLDVAMTANSARRFMATVKAAGRPDRVLDNMDTNKNYPDFTLRYGDSNTLVMVPYAPVTHLPHIAVTIHIIRFHPGRGQKLYGVTKKFWSACTQPIHTAKSMKKRILMAGCHGLKAILLGRWFSRMLFRKWLSLHQENKKGKKIAVGGGKYAFTPAILATPASVTLEGHTFPTFAQPEVYLTALFGEGYAEHTPAFPAVSANGVVSFHVSYDAYREQLRRQPDRRSAKRQKRKMAWLQARVALCNRKINRYYAIVDRTQKRFALYEMYQPMKEQLLQLHREGKYEELNELLKPYRSALWACYQKGLSLCFDKDIFEITMDILLREGRKKYVRKLRAGVPKSHWEPLVITDYKGEPIVC